jgi:hypothetical protein
MPKYRVSWAVTVEADSPMLAAKDALARQVVADRPSGLFVVRGPDGSSIIDLDTESEAPADEPPFIDDQD